MSTHTYFLRVNLGLAVSAGRWGLEASLLLQILDVLLFYELN